MAVAPRIDYPHIVSDPNVHGGEPVVAGTRIPVRAVVVAWREYQDAKTVLAAYPRLTVATLAEVLDYYESHRDQVDKSIQAQAEA